MSAQGATGGFVVTSGVFTDDAKSFAKGRNIELVDGQALTAMIEEVRAARLTATPIDKEPELYSIQGTRYAEQEHRLALVAAA